MSQKEKQIEDDVSALTVRVPRPLVHDIDQVRNARPVKVPRNTWILEAVVEKLDRERNGKWSGSSLEVDNGEE